MHITKYREEAKKVEVTEEYGVAYYNIFVGQWRIAEYISEVWIDRIVDGFNLLQKQEVDEINAKRARVEYDSETKKEIDNGKAATTDNEVSISKREKGKAACKNVRL